MVRDVDDDRYVTIRDKDSLGTFIGCRLVDVTQHDESDYIENGLAFVQLQFDNGNFIRFYIGDEGMHSEIDGIEVSGYYGVDEDDFDEDDYDEDEDEA